MLYEYSNIYKMVAMDLNPDGYEISVIKNPIMGGASRYLRIRPVEGGDFQSFIFTY